MKFYHEALHSYAFSWIKKFQNENIQCNLVPDILEEEVLLFNKCLDPCILGEFRDPPLAAAAAAAIFFTCCLYSLLSFKWGGIGDREAWNNYIFVSNKPT